MFYSRVVYEMFRHNYLLAVFTVIYTDLTVCYQVHETKPPVLLKGMTGTPHQLSVTLQCTVVVTVYICILNRFSLYLNGYKNTDILKCLNAHSNFKGVFHTPTVEHCTITIINKTFTFFSNKLGMI